MKLEELKDIINECILLRENALAVLENYFDGPENYDDIINEKIDADEGYGAKLRPVFIVLLYSDSTFDKIAEKFVKGQKYWHASIGFGPALSKCYSFNFGEAYANRFKGGLSFESIDFYKREHPTGTMEVSCIFLSKFKYDKLKATLNYYIENKEKTKYSFINLIYSLFGKQTKDKKFNLVCSTFVDTILKSINVKISDAKSINLTKPDDLMKQEKNEKQFKIFEGKIKDYNTRSVIRKVEKLANDVNNNYFKR